MALLRYLTSRDIRLPKRSSDSHKGDNGRVLVVGGSEEYTGAPELAALAALRSGADLVTVAAPERVAWAINAASPDLITVKIKDERFREQHADAIVDLARSVGAVVFGNGLGRDPTTAAFVRKVFSLLSLRQGEKPVWVIDADALHTIGAAQVPVQGCVLTPHHGELAAIAQNAGVKLSLSDSPAANAREIQQKLAFLLGKGNVIVLKGRIDLIVSAEEYRLNRTGNAGMTVGGTGDVLAGLCAGLISQGMSHFQAACAAAYVNGAAGDILYRRVKCGFLASELASQIPFVLKGFRK